MVKGTASPRAGTSTWWATTHHPGITSRWRSRSHAAPVVYDPAERPVCNAMPTPQHALEVRRQYVPYRAGLCAATSYPFGASRTLRATTAIECAGCALLLRVHRVAALPSSSPSPAPSSARKTLWLLVRVAVTLAALGWLSTQVELNRIAAILATVPPGVLATHFVALLGTASLHATRLTLLLRASTVELRWAVLSVVLRAAFVGAVSPRGGADIARVAWLSRAAGRVEPVLAAALVGRILDIVPWLLMLLWGIGSGVLAQNPPLLASATLFSAAFVFVLAATVVLGAFGRPLAERLPIFRARALLIADAVRTLGRSPRPLAIVALLGLGVGALNVWSVYVVATALGAELPVLHAVGVVPAMDTVISLPVTISEWAARGRLRGCIRDPRTRARSCGGRRLDPLVGRLHGPCWAAHCLR